MPATALILKFSAGRSSSVFRALDSEERISLSAFLPFFAILDACWACGFPVTVLGPATGARGPAFLPS